MSPEPMDVSAVVEKLNAALELQHRSALQFTLMAGGTQGFEYQSLAELLWRFAAAELDDTRRLVEKIVALGGDPTCATVPYAYQAEPSAAFEALLDNECEAIAALHAVIPDPGQDPRSEALEPMLEHALMRKQERIDVLLRATRQT